MARRSISSIWNKAFARNLKTLTRKVSRGAARAGTRVAGKALKTALQANRAPPGEGDWIAGVALGTAGHRRYRLYRPAPLAGEGPLPLVVMLHGCGQDANSFARSTRMNRIASRERFMVLYPEQDRLANAQGCWNWFDTRSGRAYAEAALLMKAIEQVTRLYAVDPERIAVAGLSAGASMAALLATRHPERFKAVVMHSGVPPGTAHSTLSALGAMRGRRGAPPSSAAPGLPGLPGAPPPPDWPPLLVIHGTMDPVVAASNGREAAQLWADAVGARATAPRQVQRGKRHPMAVTDFKRGRLTVATWVQVARLGHAWSGGAASQPFSDAQGADASRMVWAFAAKQFGR